MPPVAVRILHRVPPASGGPLERALAGMRARTGDHVRDTFARLRAEAQVVAGPPDPRSFGARLRALAAELPPDGGLVVLGSGAIPTARATDLAPFLVAAARGERIALANNRYSADVVAIACTGVLRGVPDLTSDNALPRWLAEVAGYRVDDLRGRWRLQLDIDTPLDGLLLGEGVDGIDGIESARAALRGVRAVAADPGRELLVLGRTSAAGLRWLERSARARVRALVEERGLRTSRVGQRPPASVLGLLLEREGPHALGTLVAALGDGALIDSRVLLAHRSGADERAWPPAEDRYASDLLMPDRIADPWLRDLTAAARDAPVPIVLGGHTLVGPGIRLALRRSR